MSASARKEKIDGVIMTSGIQLGYIAEISCVSVLNWQPKVKCVWLPKAFDNPYNTRQIMAEGSS